MGIGPVGSSADEEDDSELAHLETRSAIAKPLKGSPQTVLNDSVVEKSSKGYMAVLISWRHLSLDEHS